jgi:alkanesulfonate monooxygenase SsuD/methylene tetrahydromethanopterin reductase-like flavin-dependent oxidoreductase (luciferase family)
VSKLEIGVALWSQSSGWDDFLEAARRAERLGFDHLWTWDHLLAIFGEAQQPIFEGYTTLAAVAATTTRIRLGLFVGANTFRNPALAAKSLTTIDHISGGRAILGIGGAWFETEHRAYGIDFGGGHGQRLDWLAEAVPAIRALLDGEEVTSSGGRYAFDRLRLAPPPVQAHLPIMVGGAGERKTLPIVARWADMWNAFGSPEALARKDGILRAHCAEVGRDPEAIVRSVGCKVTIRRTEAEAQAALASILARNGLTPAAVADDETFWTGTPEQIAERMLAYRRVGFHAFIVESPAPYDAETMERLIGEVRPMVEAGGEGS